jgi:hypothetical protein
LIGCIVDGLVVCWDFVDVRVYGPWGLVVRVIVLILLSKVVWLLMSWW